VPPLFLNVEVTLARAKRVLSKVTARAESESTTTGTTASIDAANEMAALDDKNFFKNVFILIWLRWG
jgi:hypothetical protein